MTPQRKRMIRLGILFAIVIALVIVGATTGVRDRFTIENLRAQAVASGPWGILIFCAAFCVGELLYIPGTVFLVAAVLAWGRVAGAGIGFVAGMLAIKVTFLLVRGAGGQALGESKRPFIRRVMANLDQRPIRVVFILRLLFWTSPPLNYAFALSSLTFRDHLIGSALGLVLPVVGMALFTEQVVKMLGY